MGDQASIDRQTLHELYAAALAHRVEAAPVLQAIATRASLAIGLLAPAMAELGDQALQDREQRLLAALEPHPELDPVTDAVEREVARVQLEALDLEMTRRRSTTATDLSGTPAPPTRPGLQGAVMDTIALVQEEGITAPDVESVRRIAGIVRRHILQGAGDGSLVAALLREVAMLPTPHAVDASWRFPAIALEMVVRCRDLVADTPLPVDPATLAQAVRAKRLLYGITRSDSRVDAIDWPLDLDALTVAQLLDDQAHAYTEWVRAGIPESDVGQYLAPSRREERGRPSPHEQVVPEHHARAAAEAAGGLPIPLIYPVHPQERHDVLEALWTQGLAGRHPEPGGIPPQQIGIVLYTAGGHPSVRWGATNYSFGPLAVVILPPRGDTASRPQSVRC